MRCRYEETRFRNENDGYCVLCYSTEDPEVPEGARNKYRGEDRFILLQLVQNFLLRKIRR